MTFYEFTTYPAEVQANVTWDLGVFLGYRQRNGTRYVLYQLEGFYVEIHYDMAENRITCQASFTGPALPGSYFEQ